MLPLCVEPLGELPGMLWLHDAKGLDTCAAVAAVAAVATVAAAAVAVMVTKVVELSGCWCAERMKRGKDLSVRGGRTHGFHGCLGRQINIDT